MALPGAGTRRFVYDAAGRVMGEYGLSAADVKAEYIWLSPEVGAGGSFGGDDGLGGYMPLAVATPDGGGTIQLNWVHGNHLGVPLITTDANGITATSPGFLPIRWSALPSTVANGWLSFRPCGIARKMEGSI